MIARYTTGMRIREGRTRLGMTQLELARLAGVGPCYIYSLERSNYPVAALPRKRAAVFRACGMLIEHNGKWFDELEIGAASSNPAADTATPEELALDAAASARLGGG